LEGHEVNEGQVQNAEANPLVDNFEKTNTLVKVEITPAIKEERDQMSQEDKRMDEDEGVTLSEYLNLKQGNLSTSENVQNPEQTNLSNLASKSTSNTEESVKLGFFTEEGMRLKNVGEGDKFPGLHGKKLNLEDKNAFPAL